MAAAVAAVDQAPASLVDLDVEAVPRSPAVPVHAMAVDAAVAAD